MKGRGRKDGSDNNRPNNNRKSSGDEKKIQARTTTSGGDQQQQEQGSKERSFFEDQVASLLGQGEGEAADAGNNDDSDTLSSPQRRMRARRVSAHFDRKRRVEELALHPISSPDNCNDQGNVDLSRPGAFRVTRSPQEGHEEESSSNAHQGNEGTNNNEREHQDQALPQHHHVGEEASVRRISAVAVAAEVPDHREDIEYQQFLNAPRVEATAVPDRKKRRPLAWMKKRSKSAGEKEKLTTSPSHEDQDESYRIEGGNLMQAASFNVSDRSRISSDPNSSFSSSIRNSSISESNRSSYTAILPSQEATSEEKRRSQEIREINKLRFDSMDLVGREREMQLLRSSLRGESKKLILIDGEAGSGKTALAFSLKDDVTAQGGMFCSGKFDLQLREIPYSGIVQACGDICSQLLMEESSGTSSRYANVQATLLNGLGTNQRKLLEKLIPSLKSLLLKGSQDENEVQEADSSEDVASQLQLGSEQSLNELNYAFRVFFRLLSSIFPVFIIVLDDLQWADAASIALLETLLLDKDESNVVILGLYRTNEVSAMHPINVSIRTMARMSSRYGFSASELSVGHLSVADTQKLLEHLLHQEENPSIESLAGLCHRRTEGNAFFLVNFIRRLNEKDILRFDIASSQWIWNLEDAEEVGAAENIVDLLEEKMLTYPQSVRRFLLTAACLGSAFEFFLLQLVWDNIPHDDGNELEGCADLVDLCIHEGFLEQRQSSQTYYQWVHDKVQEAALTLTKSRSVSATKFLIGSTLKSALDDKQLKDHVFLIVNLLNESTNMKNEDQAIEMAKLNLRAAQQSSSLSAFSSAAQYAETGFKLLPSNHWRSHFELTASLAICAAESFGCLGNTVSLYKYADEILNAQMAPKMLKSRANELKIHNMYVRGEVENAHIEGIRLLRDLGVQFPSGKVATSAAVVHAVLSTKRVVGKIDVQSIMKIPLMKDRKHLDVLRILDRLSRTAYFLKSDLLPVIAWKMMSISMKYGFSEYSVNGFLVGGIVLVRAFADYAGVARLGAAVIRYYHEKQELFKSIPKAVFAGRCWFEPWTGKLLDICGQLMMDYPKCLEIGDSENALWCAFFHFGFAFQSGRPLGLLRDDMPKYINQAKELGLTTMTSPFRAYYEAVVKSIGDGEGLDSDLMFDEDGALEMQNHFHEACERGVHILNNDFDQASNLALERDAEALMVDPGNPVSMVFHFYACYALLGKASSPGCERRLGRKLVKLSNRIHRGIKDLSRKGSPSVVHYDVFLDAELARYRGNMTKAEQYYQKAASLAADGGFVQDAAMANERYCRFLLLQQGRRHEALTYLDKAIAFFALWESPMKVSELTEFRSVTFGGEAPH